MSGLGCGADVYGGVHDDAAGCAATMMAWCVMGLCMEGLRLGRVGNMLLDAWCVPADVVVCVICGTHHAVCVREHLFYCSQHPTIKLLMPAVRRCLIIHMPWAIAPGASLEYVPRATT